MHGWGFVTETDGVLARRRNFPDAHEARRGGRDVAQGQPRQAGVAPHRQLPPHDHVRGVGCRRGEREGLTVGKPAKCIRIGSCVWLQPAKQSLPLALQQRAAIAGGFKWHGFREREIETTVVLRAPTAKSFARPLLSRPRAIYALFMGSFSISSVPPRLTGSGFFAKHW